MKTRIALLHFGGCVLLAGTVSLSAQTSDLMRERIRATLPNYAPQADAPKKPESPVGTPAPLTDDETVHLPDFAVTTRGPGRDPDSWLNKEGLQRKAMRDYRASMNELTWALNRWYVPLPFGYSLTPSPQARADAQYMDRKVAGEFEDIARAVKAISISDPVEGKKLEKELERANNSGG